MRSKPNSQEFLHNEDGTLNKIGYFKHMEFPYLRSRVKASALRIKEWDYYFINDEKYYVCMTIGDLGFGALFSVSLIDLGVADKRIIKPTDPALSVKGIPSAAITVSDIVPLTLGKIKMPPTSGEGTTEVSGKKVQLRFEVADGKRKLTAHASNFFEEQDLDINIELSNEPQDTMVISTPFAEKPTAFYYNQKIIGMQAQGYFTLGNFKHEFEKNEALGLLDWGRGVWTRDNTWYWAAAQGHQDGHVIGFNLGYGFGDTSKASENVFFLDGIAHKLDRVDFGIPGDSNTQTMNSKKGICPKFLQDWHFTSNDGRIDFTFTPIIDRADYINFGIIVSDQHQVMGRANGYVILDNEQKFEFANLLMAGEKVRNKW